MNKPLSETHPSLTLIEFPNKETQERIGDKPWNSPCHPWFQGAEKKDIQLHTTDNAVLLDYLVDLQEQYSPVHFAEMSSQHFFDLLEQLKTNLSLIKDGDA